MDLSDEQLQPQIDAIIKRVEYLVGQSEYKSHALANDKFKETVANLKRCLDLPSSSVLASISEALHLGMNEDNEFEDEVDCAVVDSVEFDLEELESKSEDNFVPNEAEVLESKMTENEIYNNYEAISVDSAGEHNCKFKTKNDFSNRDEASSMVAILKYKVDSTFLDYQEGKPFISEPNLFNIFADFHREGVSYNEIHNFNILNLVLSEQFWQFRNWQLITDGNLNSISSYFSDFIRLYSISYTTGITYVVVNLPNYDFSRRLFDRGRLDVESRFSYFVKSSSKFYHEILTSSLLLFNKLIRMDNYDRKFVLETDLKLGYQIELLYEHGSVFLLAKDSVSCDDSQQFMKMLPNDNTTNCVMLHGRMRMVKVHKAYEIFTQMLHMWEEELFTWRHKCGMFDEKEVYYLGSLLMLKLVCWKRNFAAHYDAQFHCTLVGIHEQGWFVIDHAPCSFLKEVLASTLLMFNRVSWGIKDEMDYTWKEILTKYYISKVLLWVIFLRWEFASLAIGSWSVGNEIVVKMVRSREMLQQVHFAWTVSILQMEKENEFGSTLQLFGLTSIRNACGYLFIFMKLMGSPKFISSGSHSWSFSGGESLEFIAEWIYDELASSLHFSQMGMEGVGHESGKTSYSVSYKRELYISHVADKVGFLYNQLWSCEFQQQDAISWQEFLVWEVGDKEKEFSLLIQLEVIMCFCIFKSCSRSVNVQLLHLENGLPGNTTASCLRSTNALQTHFVKNNQTKASLNYIVVELHKWRVRVQHRFMAANGVNWGSGLDKCKINEWFNQKHKEVVGEFVWQRKDTTMKDMGYFFLLHYKIYRSFSYCIHKTEKMIVGSVWQLRLLVVGVVLLCIGGGNLRGKCTS